MFTHTAAGTEQGRQPWCACPGRGWLRRLRTCTYVYTHTHTHTGPQSQAGGKPWAALCLLELQPPLRIYQPRRKKSLALDFLQWGPLGSSITLLLGIKWKFSPWSTMQSRLTRRLPLSWAEGPPNDGRAGGRWGPHLLGAAWPNKPSLFGVTFDAVPTGSHTSPNPAKICAKLNQSILEMALVRFCQGDRLQGMQRSGGAIRTWELVGGRSKPLKASYSLRAGEEAARTPASWRASSPRAVGFAGGVSGGPAPPAAWLDCCRSALDGGFSSQLHTVLRRSGTHPPPGELTAGGGPGKPAQGNPDLRLQDSGVWSQGALRVGG